MNNAITEQSSWAKIGVEVIDVLFVQWGAVIYFQIYSVVSQSQMRHNLKSHANEAFISDPFTGLDGFCFVSALTKLSY